MKTAFVFLIVILSLQISCSSLGQMVRNLAGTNQSDPAKANNVANLNRAKAYSETKNYGQPVEDRQYRRMTREQLEKESKLHASEGSLWVMEGQSSYLFTANQLRLVGDIVNVVLESSTSGQLKKKVDTIENLMKAKMAKLAPPPQANKNVANAAAPAAAPAPAPAPAAPAAADAPAVGELDIKNIPTRIVETYPDGSYRVKGSTTMLIGSKEFRVLVTGLARNTDINDDSINSTRLLDAQFDIVRTGGKL